MRGIRVFFTLILILLLVYTAINVFIPASYRVQRYVDVDTSKKELYNYLRNLNSFSEWSPWIDDTKVNELTIEGLSGELGSMVRFESKVKGKGFMKLSHLNPTNKIDYSLQFDNDKSVRTAYFTLVRLESGKTRLSFGIKGTRIFPLRLFNLMVDRKIGSDIENGLNAIIKSRQSI